MKRIRFILLAAVLLAVITFPAFGANENPNKGSLLVITGVINDIQEDCNGWDLCLKLTDYWDNDYTINVDQDTRCVEKIDELTNQKLECTDLVEGDFVSVQYVEGENLAIRVNVDADLIHFP